MPVKRKKSAPKVRSRRTILIMVVVLLILLVGGLWLWHSSPSASKSATTSTQPNTTSAKQYAATSTTGTSSGGSTSSSSSTTTASLAAPSGQLLNTQTVSLSSGPDLESICQTIANASCDIRLTQGSVTKYVGAQTTGSNGMVIFDWNAATVGLTTGQWSVQAVVTQNNATGVSHTETLTVQS